MNLNDAYWSERITVRQDLVGGWILGRDPSNSYTAKSFLLFKPDGNCCTSLIIRESDAMLLYSSLRAAELFARNEGHKAGQDAMRARACISLQHHIDDALKLECFYSAPGKSKSLEMVCLFRSKAIMLGDRLRELRDLLIEEPQVFKT